MIRRTVEIVGSSFTMALQELWKNKLRTFLSLFGVTIGIFCIIGVLATVSSLERNIRNEIDALGNNAIYIDKWVWVNTNDYPWWKYVNRPSPRYKEIKEIKERTSGASSVAFKIEVTDNIEYRNSILSQVKIYGITEDYNNIQPVEVSYGRYPTESEFDRGSNVAVVGNEIAEMLFNSAETAVDKYLTIRGRKLLITGVIKKQGKQMIDGGWQFDQSVFLPYKFARTIMDERRSSPLIMVKGKEELSSKALKDELSGTMRAVHKLSPTKDDDFALNDINDISESVSSAFVSLNIGGWAIAALSLIVGMFGVANIMFVSVRERTGQIGLKKAVGAKNHIILTEFLLESAFLCVIGGLIGLLLVFILTQILSSALDFPVFISTDYMILAIAICIVVGIVAGIFPAYKASRMDPVVAIRSK